MVVLGDTESVFGRTWALVPCLLLTDTTTMVVLQFGALPCADRLSRSDSRRGTIRREKSRGRARGTGQGARQTSSRHPIDPGVVRLIIPTGPVARARSRAAVRASAGLRQTLIPSDGIGKGKGLKNPYIKELRRRISARSVKEPPRLVGGGGRDEVYMRLLCCCCCC